jgi:predicted SPOUT superfamily RNA methylase MTH1
MTEMAMIDEEQQALSRKRRKLEGKELKRQRIEESGGVRPRQEGGGDSRESSGTTKSLQYGRSSNNNNKPRNIRPPSSKSKHRFGRVMEQVPCRNKPRYSTVSIALPGSVLANCQTKELRTLLVGQIARAATIYHVDEIVVFDDKLGNDKKQSGSGGSGWRDFKRQKRLEEEHKDEEKDKTSTAEEKPDRPSFPKSNHQEFMARLLQYCECPQYLRRTFFPMHPDLQFAGLLAPIDAPHHVRQDDHCKYREGVVIPYKKGPNGHSLVNCGIRNRPVEIDRTITAGVRCTVQINTLAYGKPGHIQGKVVSPAAPREDNGTYWGYETRMASSINAVLEECPYEGGYDLKIGTSERGDKNVESNNFKLAKYTHSLIVFGGVAGIEECVDADESLKVSGSQSRVLFDVWLNTCPFQGSRTIRTEEAVMISLSKLSPFLNRSGRDKPVESHNEVEEEDVEFSDDSPSDESSDEEGDEGVKEKGSQPEMTSAVRAAAEQQQQ